MRLRDIQTSTRITTAIIKATHSSTHKREDTHANQLKQPYNWRKEIEQHSTLESSLAVYLLWHW
jgi:hypothetical protein